MTCGITWKAADWQHNSVLAIIVLALDRMKHIVQLRAYNIHGDNQMHSSGVEAHV